MPMQKLRLAGLAAATLALVSGYAVAQDTAPRTQPRRPNRGDPVAPAQPTQPANPDPAGTTPATPPAAPAPTAPSPSNPVIPPVAPPAGPKREAPKPGPYLRQIGGKDWNFRASIDVRSTEPGATKPVKDDFTGKTAHVPDTTPFRFMTLGFVFPIVPASASARSYEAEMKASLLINDRVVDSTPEVLRNYPAGIALLRLDAGDNKNQIECREVRLELELPMRCVNVEFDERSASLLSWPKNPWPEEAASTFKPQLYLELGVNEQGLVQAYDEKPIADTLDAWLREAGAKDAKSMPPVALAKLITSKVWGAVQISGEGLRFTKNGELASIVIQPPSITLQNGRGTEHDAAALLCTLLRKAGLPVRTVIAWDVNDKGGNALSGGRKENRLRSWVEMYLYDEAGNTYNWIPIDVARLKKSSSRPAPLNRQWKFFGTHDELDRAVPFAFHFHPPTDVVAYGNAGIWGWFVTPQAPREAFQRLRFSVVATPNDATRRNRDRDRP